MSTDTETIWVTQEAHDRLVAEHGLELVGDLHDELVPRRLGAVELAAGLGVPLLDENDRPIGPESATKSP